MRVCPKCAHRSSDRAEHCEACGYQIVLTLTKAAKVKAAPKPKRVAPARGARFSTQGGHQRIEFEPMVEEHSLRDELAELGLL